MTRIYSVYEAKARFSELLRQVREGRTVTISYHGEPIAELRPIDRKESGIESRVRALREVGVIEPATGTPLELKPAARRPGALERFLRDREG